MQLGNLIFLRRIVCVLCFVPLLAFSQSEIPLIPKPQKMTVGEGTYTIANNVEVHAFDPFMEVAALFEELPGVDSVEVIRIRNMRRAPEEGVRILPAQAVDQLADDMYRLEVDSTGIQLIAHNEQAMVQGIMTLMQLSYLQDFYNVIPQLVIEDKPAYRYRGLHLDVSSHFFPIPFLKKYIDLMALYKFNTLHWHIAGEGGWRLQIFQYPELTRQAAWRTHSEWDVWKENGQRYIQAGHPNANGGYYTQQEVRDLVDYATRKGVAIIPEVSMVGHAEPVLTVYPELSCTGHAYSHHDFCVGNEATYDFVANVMNELVELFPSPYVHIGGGVVDTSSWQHCPKCQGLKDSLGLETEEQLHSYFTSRISDYLKERGRQLIVRDATAGVDLPDGVILMDSQGEAQIAETINAGRDVIIASKSQLNFDHYQSDPRAHPKATGGYTTLSHVYEFNPRPTGVNDDKLNHVMGGQGNVWTTHIATSSQVEYMAFPRALALAEVLWTSQADKDLEDFQARLQDHYRVLQRLHVNYYRPLFDARIGVQYDSETNSNTVSITSEQYEPTIRYTVDGVDPSAASPVYSKSFDLATSTVVKAAYFLDSVQVGPVDSAVVDLHKAIGKKVTYNTEWHTYPAQSEVTLTNGQKGSLRYEDGQWQGFLGDFDVIIDFERREQIKEVAIQFMEEAASDIFLPREVNILMSDNGTNYRHVGTIERGRTAQESALFFHRFEKTFDQPLAARYLRITAPRAQPGFLFTDEVVVY